MLSFNITSNKKKCTIEGKRVAEAMYLMYIYVYNEVFFPNLLSCEKANDRLA